MALVVKTSAPRELITAIRAKARADSSAWAVDDDGDLVCSDFARLGGKAWFHPFVFETHVVFGIIAPKNTRLSRRAYARQHAELISYLLENFDEKFDDARATAMAHSRDRVAS